MQFGYLQAGDVALINDTPIIAITATVGMTVNEQEVVSISSYTPVTPCVTRWRTGSGLHRVKTRLSEVAVGDVVDLSRDHQALVVAPALFTQASMFPATAEPPDHGMCALPVLTLDTRELRLIDGYHCAKVIGADVLVRCG